MSKTAVGLFENPGVADQVVHDLDASAITRGEIRILGEPRSMGDTGIMGTPHTDFEVGMNQGDPGNRGKRTGSEGLRPRNAAWRSRRFRDRIERRGGQGG